MSLTFSGTNVVNVGSGSTLDDVNTGTLLIWSKPNAVDQSARWFQKGNAAGSNTRYFSQLAAGSGGMEFSLTRATTTLLITTDAATTAPSWTSGAWGLTGASWSTAGADGDQHIYHGNLTTLAAEVSAYTTQRAGTGSVTSEAATDMLIGNASSGAIPFLGTIGIVGLFNRQLTLEEIQSWQFDPRVLPGCVGLWRLGDNATSTQVDLSGNGNNGTVTGASRSDNPPLIRPWGRRIFRPVYASTSTSDTATPTGVSGTFALGTVTVAIGPVVDATGQAGTFALGTPTVQIDSTPAVTGQLGTFGLGTVTVNTSGNETASPSGLAATFALGTPDFAITSSSDATGLTATFALGNPTVVVDSTAAITGLSGTFALGTVSVSTSGNETAAPSGQAATFTLGTPTVALSPTTAPTGLTATFALGTPTTVIDCTVVVTGQQMAASLGNVSIDADGNASVTLTGLAGTFTLGTPTILVDSTVTLIGQAMAAALGIVAVTGEATGQLRVTDLSGPRYTATDRGGSRYTATWKD